jgi:hypothetical protein
MSEAGRHRISTLRGVSHGSTPTLASKRRVFGGRSTPAFAMSKRLSELTIAGAQRPQVPLNQAVPGEGSSDPILPRCSNLESRDAPVMRAQIETPAFAGVSLAGHKPDSSAQGSSNGRIWLNHALSRWTPIPSRAAKCYGSDAPVMHGAVVVASNANSADQPPAYGAGAWSDATPPSMRGGQERASQVHCVGRSWTDINDRLPLRRNPPPRLNTMPLRVRLAGRYWARTSDPQLVDWQPAITFVCDCSRLLYRLQTFPLSPRRRVGARLHPFPALVVAPGSTVPGLRLDE